LLPTKHAVVLLSGGLDSSTLLAQLRFEDFECSTLAVNYGQRHERELASADAVALHYGVPFHVVDLAEALSPIFASARSSQVGQRDSVPHGHYAAESMKTTIVPNRNFMLLGIAGALAESIGARVVAYAAHAGDHFIYPDCRPEFIGAARQALQLGTDWDGSWNFDVPRELGSRGVTLYTPFSRITKTDIVRRGAMLKVPFELTWSCYDPQGGTPEHCGLCGTCVERREAFREAGVVDPTSYAVAVR
jgi:7-cyano-7-deazaguanine synthase